MKRLENYLFKILNNIKQINYNIMKVEIFYDAKCKHCKNFKSHGRGKPVECIIKSKPLWLGGKTPACDKFILN